MIDVVLNMGLQPCLRAQPTISLASLDDGSSSLPDG
jgi:hypothetical protein